MRLINASALKMEVRKEYDRLYPTASGEFDEFATRVIPYIIDEQPTVDAVEVVRCKDCQYSHEPSVLVKGLVECEKSCSGECLKREDWYCPLGERRG